jgi:cyanophycinase
MIPKGILISIGGDVDKGTPDEPMYPHSNQLVFFEEGILIRFLQEMKGIESKVEIITTASEIPNEVGQNYVEAFARLGSYNTHLMHIRDHADAQKQEYIDRIRTADGVLFTGGNQKRLSMAFLNTEFLDVLQHRYQNEHFVIAGTSAGAMAMSNVMIYEGSSDEALLKGAVKITQGLGFMHQVIIDSHFVKRGRFGRLAQSICTHQNLIGIGLGEDTGVLVRHGNQLETVGSGLVLIFDGSEIQYSNIDEIEEGRPIAIAHLVVHVLAKGNYYMLNQRKFYHSHETVKSY